VRYAHRDYIEQFLNETKAYVPCLMELEVVDFQLKAVTKNFTREDTRRNCVKIKQSFTLQSIEHSREFCVYFPLIEM